MKKLFSLVICVMALLFASCEPNAPATSNNVVTGAAKDVTTSSVVLYGEVNVDISAYEDVEFGMMISEVKDDLNNRDGEMFEAKVLMGKEFKLELTNLSPATEYYYCAWVFLNNTQYEFGDIKEFTTEALADGIGIFSVSPDKQVTFSPGNLQYHPANNVWQFAANQTDYIGADNSNISDTYGGWLDLFGWSTSANYFGVNTSHDWKDYYGSFVDWGTNKIGNDAPNIWRTLTYDEWYYLRYTRTNANDLCGVARVNGVNGLIFLPDYWTCPAGITFKSGFPSSYYIEYYYQTFTADQWSKLEKSGAVFLPAAERRHGTYAYDVQDYGYYWSATAYDSYDAYSLRFYSERTSMDYYNRFFGHSVRLVKDLQ